MDELWCFTLDSAELMQNFSMYSAEEISLTFTEGTGVECYPADYYN